MRVNLRSRKPGFSEIMLTQAEETKQFPQLVSAPYLEDRERERERLEGTR
jgi:hypothetical protein